MAEQEPSEAPNPFRIRAHHLYTLQPLFRADNFLPYPDPINPLLLSSLTMDVYRRMKSRAGDGPKGAEENLIAIDTVGETPAEEGTYQTRTLTLYNRFLKLPADHPIHITVKPDEVCGTCIAGRHCTLYKPRSTNQSNALKYDEAMMGVFLHHMERWPDLKETVRVVDDEVTYDDAGTFPTRRVETVAGTVHKFLKATHPINFSLGLVDSH